MSLLGHRLLSSSIILLLICNFAEISEMKSNEDIEHESDLTYSDSSHGLQTAGAHQQVLFIDHGGGAISQIRRTSFIPNPSVPSLPYRPHVNHYPNSVYENNHIGGDEPFVNFPEDIHRILDSPLGPQTHSPITNVPQTQPFLPFIPQDIRPQPIPAPIQQPPPPQLLHHPLSHHIPQPLLHSSPQLPQYPLPQPIFQPNPHQFSHPNPQPIPQLIQHPIVQPIQQIQPNPHPMSAPVGHSVDPDLLDERFLIHNEIERIPKPSNQIKPTQELPVQPMQPPVQPPVQPMHLPVQLPVQPPVQHSVQPRGHIPVQGPPNPFYNFGDGPELLNFDSPFDPFSQIGPLFQRRRLTAHNNGQELNPNSIGYPSYTYYKGGGDENPMTNWPKIFKFSDGRTNLYDFEKQKKQNKIKFNSKDIHFDHISRDSFLILHGGTFAQ